MFAFLGDLPEEERPPLVEVQEWADKGWRIDIKSLRDQRGDRAFAIPCPARRTTKNWVQKTIPLLPGS